jgi:hypothetical protein
MALRINAAVFASDRDENESPQVFSKRKSELISPLCGHPMAECSSSTTAAAVHRGPLSDVHNSKAEKAMTTIAAAAPAAYVGRSTRPSLPAAAAATTAANHSAVKKYNKFKSLQLSKEEIEATDEKQASVNQLSGWLANEAAKKNKKPPIHRPLAATSSNPVRFQAKPRIKKEDVEATDDKRVSVKTLSSWMSGDPFEQKKVRTLRTGSNVIAKSRMFERENEMRADKQCDIRPGSVEERLAWLSGAFKHEGDENGTAVMSAQEKKVVRPYQSKPKRDEMPSEESENELMSVRDKKEWLSKAFKRGGEGAAIHEIKSFEEQHHSHGCATPGIHQTKSIGTKHDDPAPGKTKSAATDDTCASAIDQTKSFDGIGRPPTQNPFKKNVVRLYQKGDEYDEARPEEALKSVHDKQAWLSSAFKKPTGGVGDSHHGSPAVAKDVFRKLPNAAGGQIIHTVDSETDSIVDRGADPPTASKLMTDGKTHAPGVDDMDKMSVAERARWLQGAFKK